MRFRIDSDPRWEGPPLPGAVRRPFVRVDRRTTSDPAKIPAHSGRTDWWYSEGRGHCVGEDGQIRRYFDDEAWFLEITDLQHLKDYLREVGMLTIGPEDPGCEGADFVISVWD